MILKPGILLCFLSHLTNFITIGYVDTTLAKDMMGMDKSMTTTKIGMYFLICGITEMTLAPFWVFAVNRVKQTFFLMIVGFFLSAVALGLSGPMWPFDARLNSFALIAVRQFIQGLSNGPQVLAAFTGGNKELIRYGSVSYTHLTLPTTPYV